MRVLTLKKQVRKMISKTDKMKAMIAGYIYHCPVCAWPQIEKAAPMTGPKRKPRLNATPISAIPFPLEAGVDTSVITAVERLTLPDNNTYYLL